MKPFLPQQIMKTSERVMEVESQRPPQVDQEENHQMNKRLKLTLQILSFASLAVGATFAPLTLRIYYIHGGQRKWFSGWLQTVAFPLTLLPLAAAYLHRRRRAQNGAERPPPPRLLLSTPSVLLAAAVCGILMGVDDFFYAYGAAYLPVSTSSIILSTELAFTALFAFLMVRQRFTAASTNALVLLIAGSVMLGLGSDRDRPEGESKMKYYLGFAMMVGAAAIYGLVLVLLEFTYAKARQAVCFTVTMEVQLVMGIVATAFCTVGMIVNHDFQVIGREARGFGLGEMKYYMVVIWSAVLCELLFLGTVGSIFYGSALLAGVILATSLPVTEILAVVFLSEPFNAEKGMALVLSLWGFTSYLYGEHRMKNKKKNKSVEKVVIAEQRLEGSIN